MIPHMKEVGRGSESNDSGRGSVGSDGVPGAGGGSSAGPAAVAARKAGAKGSPADHADAVGNPRDAGGGSSAGPAAVAARKAGAKGSPADHANAVSNPRDASGGSRTAPAAVDCGGADAGEAIFKILPEAGSAGNDASFKQELQNVAAITKAVRLNGQVEFPDVVRLGKETVSMMSDRARSAPWLPVDARELELFTRSVVLAAQVIGTEQITRAVNEVLSDPSIRKTLHQIANNAPQMDEVVDQATSKITPTDDPNRGTLRRLVLGSAILIAAGAGVIVPLVAGVAMAEVILTNEVAIAAVAIGAAALIKQS